jgi:serine/threonine-protein kinase
MFKVVPRAGDTMADRYILERPVAEGGMGSVWRAKHRTLGRSFAIKFLKTAVLGGESLEQRFFREARLAASVQHRFVVAIVDYGVTDETVPYMVMEFLQGESLDRRAHRGPPLSVRELLRICGEVSLGLEAVHQAGVIHRDLKPDNIMLVREADGIIPKLVDFGISRPEVERIDGKKRLTHPGAFMGTPWYMSPEQARRAEGDRRSDIYSMGVIIYEALVGQAPFDHPELPALLEAVKAGGAAPLVSRRPELGVELSAIVERAMALDPAARFDTAAELAARLLEASAQLPATLMCPDPPVVSRTDTEFIDRPSPSPRNQTQELDGSRQDLVVRRAGSGRWLDPRRERAVAVAGALLGAACLLWAAGKARNVPAALPPATTLQASAQPIGPEGMAGIRAADDPGAPVSAGARGERTFTAPALSRPTASGPAGAPPEEIRRAGRKATRHADGRGRVAIPDVFRTPGF